MGKYSFEDEEQNDVVLAGIWGENCLAGKCIFMRAFSRVHRIRNHPVPYHVIKIQMDGRSVCLHGEYLQLM